MFKYTNRGDQIPELFLNPDYQHYLDVFWEIRSMCGDSETPIRPSLIFEWQSHTYQVLQKWERDLVFDLDRAFRQSRAEVLEFHSKRKAIDLEDKDKGRLNGRHRRSRF